MPNHRVIKIYRIQLSTLKDSSLGFRYFKTEQEAFRFARHWQDEYEPDDYAQATMVELSIKLSKSGIAAFLNLFAAHPDNG